MSRKKHKNYNPFDKMSDEEFLRFFQYGGKIVPNWVDCSKEEYEANVPKPLWDDSKEYSQTEKIKAFILGEGNYRRYPIIEGGILDQIKGKAKIIGYKYSKIEGSRRVFVCGSQMADWIYKREQQLKKDNNYTALTYLCDGCPKLRADGTCSPTYGECPEYESFFNI